MYKKTFSFVDNRTTYIQLTRATFDISLVKARETLLHNAGQRLLYYCGGILHDSPAFQEAVTGFCRLPQNQGCLAPKDSVCLIPKSAYEPAHDAKEPKTRTAAARSQCWFV